MPRTLASERRSYRSSISFSTLLSTPDASSMSVMTVWSTSCGWATNCVSRAVYCCSSIFFGSMTTNRRFIGWQA
jgi:hypothetical protein